MIKPINDYFVVKLEDLTTTSLGGILLVSTLTTEQVTGTVVAVGPGKYNNKNERVPICVNVNDKVLLMKNAGKEVILNKEKFQICTESNIIGIIS